MNIEKSCGVSGNFGARRDHRNDFILAYSIATVAGKTISIEASFALTLRLRSPWTLARTGAEC